MKLLIALAFSITSLMANSTPSDDHMVNPLVVANFQKTFSTAQSVSWIEGEAFFKAQFMLNNQYVSAYFSKEGSLLGIARNLSVTQLPVLLQAELKSVQQNNWISDVFEVTNDESGTTYYLTLENADEKIILQSSGNKWTLHQRKPKP